MLDRARAALRATVRDVPDFPTPGIGFKDIAPMLADAAAFAAVIDGLDALLADTEVDYVVGVESRGFILAAPLAVRRGCGLVLVRKAGKLPGPVHSFEYDLEYGSATLQMQADAFAGTQGRTPRVAVVDDVLATGGTMIATGALLEQCGARVVTLVVAMELAGLAGPTLAEHDVRYLLTV